MFQVGDIVWVRLLRQHGGDRVSIITDIYLALFPLVLPPRTNVSHDYLIQDTINNYHALNEPIYRINYLLDRSYVPYATPLAKRQGVLVRERDLTPIADHLAKLQERYEHATQATYKAIQTYHTRVQP